MKNKKSCADEIREITPLAIQMKSKNDPAKSVCTKKLAEYTEKSALLIEMRQTSMSPEEFAAYILNAEREDAVSASTLRRWTKLRNKDLVDKTMTLLGKARTGRPREVQDEVLLWALPRFSVNKKRKIKGIYGDLVEWAKPLGYRIPSYSTFRRCAMEATEEFLKKHEPNSQAFHEKHGLSIRREDGSSNDVWVVDACQLKVYVVDTDGMTFRPWIIVFMDRSSRNIMGWTICKHAPTTDDTVTALKQAIMPKRLSGVNWCGKPKEVHSDNGSIFKSEIFVANLARLGIEASYSPPACPNANGRIERLFKTVKDDFIAQFEENIRGRFIPAGEQAQAFWDVLPRQFEKWVLDYNLVRVHLALKVTPYEAWQDRMKDLSLVHMDYKKIEREIYVEREFTMTKEGVELAPGKFWLSGALVGLRKRKLTIQMAPEGPADKVVAFLGTKCLGELTWNGGTLIANTIKKATKTRETTLKELKQVLKTGYSQQNKHLGVLRRKKKTREVSPAAPAGKQRKSKRTNVVLKRTAVTTEGLL